MLAYKKLKTKQEAVDLAQWHQDQDKFIQGDYWNEQKGKGCSVGCMTHEYCAAHDNNNWHEATEHLYGIPRALSRLQDKVFEGLPIKEAKLWTVRFMSAIPEGKDLSMVVPKFLYWVLTDPDGIIKHANPNGKTSIICVSELFKRKIDGDEPSIIEWKDVHAHVHAHAVSNADNDIACAVAYAACVISDSSAHAAAFAIAHAVTAIAAADGTRKKICGKVADKLIEIISK